MTGTMTEKTTKREEGTRENGASAKARAAKVRRIREDGPPWLAQLDDAAVLDYAAHVVDVRKGRDAERAAALIEEAENAEFLAELGLDDGPQVVEPSEMRLRDTAPAPANGVEEVRDPLDRRTPQRPAPPPPADGIIPASRLSPELIVPPSAEVFWFWLGLLPHCPRAQVHLPAGDTVVNFCKSIETLHKDEITGKWSRTPRPGQFMKLSRSQVSALADVVGRTVLRIKGAATDDDPSANHPRIEVTSPPRQRPPQAIRITIPTKEEAAIRREHSRAFRDFVPHPDDVALSEFIYLRFLPGRPRHISIDSELPEPVSATGIVFPPKGATPVPENEKVIRATGTLLKH